MCVVGEKESEREVAAATQHLFIELKDCLRDFCLSTKIKQLVRLEGDKRRRGYDGRSVSDSQQK